MFLLHCGFQETPPGDIHLGNSVPFDFLCFKQTALNDGCTHEDFPKPLSCCRAFSGSRRDPLTPVAPTFICFKKKPRDLVK